MLKAKNSLVKSVHCVKDYAFEKPVCFSFRLSSARYDLRPKKYEYLS